MIWHMYWYSICVFVFASVCMRLCIHICGLFLDLCAISGKKIAHKSRNSSICVFVFASVCMRLCIHICGGTANSTCGDIFESSKLKAQSSKVECLFSLKHGKRDVRALSFELSKMSPQVGLAVLVFAFGYVCFKSIVVQGGEDSLDALNCRSFSAQEPLIIRLFCGK